jgi:hypothetical protein
MVHGVVTVVMMPKAHTMRHKCRCLQQRRSLLGYGEAFFVNEEKYEDRILRRISGVTEKGGTRPSLSQL